ncbi:UNVERIFIED_CONTAM: Adenylate kinase, chloroplastic [Sesamum radiatum]|uniref:adenylate kinase n=1 Tax=Sesamum radiatum TaxID=300843 RepID=A0AAW2PXH7_SESRA
MPKPWSGDPPRPRIKPAPDPVVASGEKAETLRVMISGAPASGKGTQCELITKKYLVHIAAGDLLRAEENGKRAKEFMERGQLVPDEIVVMVKLRLLTHNSNVEVLSMYEDVIVKVDGTLPKQEVFSKIDNILTELLERKEAALGSLAA